MKQFLLSAFLFSCSVEGFKHFSLPSQPSSAIHHRRTLKLSEQNEKNKDVEVLPKTEDMKLAAIDYSKNVVEYVKDLNPETLSIEAKEITDSFLVNAKEGVVGERGENWVLLNAVAIVILLVGNIPFLETPLNLLAGPGLLLASLVLALAAIRDLGANLSPWVSASSNNMLTTTGLYSLVRHPIYTAEVLAALGLANLTGDVSRYIMVAVLFYVLDRKATLEEKELTEKHPVYKVYKEEVPKFFPKL